MLSIVRVCHLLAEWGEEFVERYPSAVNIVMMAASSIVIDSDPELLLGPDLSRAGILPFTACDADLGSCYPGSAILAEIAAERLPELPADLALAYAVSDTG